MAHSAPPQQRVASEGDHATPRPANQHARDSGPAEREGAQSIAVGESEAQAGGQDLRDAEVFRALEMQHKNR